MDIDPRLSIGGNHPPPDARLLCAERVTAMQSAAAALISSAPQFADDPIMAAAAKLKRDCAAVRKDTDAARKAEKEPLDKAAKEVQEYYQPLIARMIAAEAELDGKMNAELKRRKDLKDQQERAAREEAYRLEREARKASEAAWSALDKLSTGEVIDETNHLEAKQSAIEAHEKADAAMAAAERIAKQTASIKVDGAKTVSIRSIKKVRLAFPRTGTREERGLALLEFFEAFASIRDGTAGYTLAELMTKLANQVYRETRQPPPHCEVYTEETVA